jgi:hypothetical protein
MKTYSYAPLFVALLHFCTLFSVVRAMNCLDRIRSFSPDDCRGAVDMIPSGSLDFSGDGGLSWTIEAKAHTRKYGAWRKIMSLSAFQFANAKLSESRTANT